MIQHLGPAILQIEVPVCDLNGFKCVETSVSHRYKYKHLKTALSNIPQKDPAAVNSKVGTAGRTPGCTVSRLQVSVVLGCICTSLLRSAGQREASSCAKGRSPLHCCHCCLKESGQGAAVGCRSRPSCITVLPL